MSSQASEKEYRDEQAYLDRTYSEIRRQIKTKSDHLEENYATATSLGEEHYEVNSRKDIGDFADSLRAIDAHADMSNFENEQLRRLTTTLKEPYFGSVELEMNGKSEVYHIGKQAILAELSLSTPEELLTGKKEEREDYIDIYVYDWRSPVASTYYNSKTGPTQYNSPEGYIPCDLKERKQIKIDKEKVTRIIKSGIYLDDVVLQEVLSKSSSPKMRDIVDTIQEEQNDVIRNVKDKKIIVQGCAGSGKTSVALHRLAYLLYNDKKITSDNMLIFSPNDVFSDYISDVLPELGERNVEQTTFSSFTEGIVKGFTHIESYLEFISKYYDGLNTEEQNRLNRFKFSNDYREALKKFIKRKTDSYRFADNFSLNGIVAKKDYLNRMVENLAGVPLQEKIDLITDAIINAVKSYRIDKDLLRMKIEKALVKPSFNPRTVYNEFLESEEFKQAYGKKGNKVTKEAIEYPDLIGMLYLNYEMTGYVENNMVHHLVIDEAQDYTPLQIEMIAKIFRGASITVLGDAAQTINPYFKYGSLEEMKAELGDTARYVELNKAYRSSREIIEYASKFIGDTKVIPVRESQDNPVVVKEVSKEQLFTELVKDILALKEKGFERICIITKSNKEATAIYEGLKGSIDNITVITTASEINPDFLVAPTYMAKGLEFDAVINYNSMENEYEEEDKYLYYVACTRAQHDLVVYNEPKMKKKVIGNGTREEKREN